MADVEMPDAGPSSAAKSKAPVAKGAKAGGADTNMEGKKRFEVKKVHFDILGPQISRLHDEVERGSPVGMGYCCGQLRYLSKPHYGSVYVL